MPDSVDQQPQATQFEHRSVIPGTLEAVRRFHENPDALALLTPFPIIAQGIRDDRNGLTAGEFEFRLWFGPLAVRWLALHKSSPEAGALFTDEMLQGPMALWEHTHILKPHANGTELIDRIVLAHQPGWRGWLTRLFFDGWALRFLFYYRHWRTKRTVIHNR